MTMTKDKELMERLDKAGSDQARCLFMIQAMNDDQVTEASKVVREIL